MTKEELIKDRWYQDEQGYYLKFDHLEDYKVWVSAYITPKGMYYASKGHQTTICFREVDEIDLAKHPELTIHPKTVNINYEIY